MCAYARRMCVHSCIEPFVHDVAAHVNYIALVGAVCFNEITFCCIWCPYGKRVKGIQILQEWVWFGDIWGQ